MSKKSKIQRPNRDPDHYSKRQVPYWWAPEWIRGTSADAIYPEGTARAGAMASPTYGWVYPCHTYGKIVAVKENGTVHLHMKNKDDGTSIIKGSIQHEFKRWHEDRMIDYMLFGLNPDEIILDEE